MLLASHPPLVVFLGEIVPLLLFVGLGLLILRAVFLTSASKRPGKKEFLGLGVCALLLLLVWLFDLL